MPMFKEVERLDNRGASRLRVLDVDHTTVVCRDGIGDRDSERRFNCHTPFARGEPRCHEAERPGEERQRLVVSRKFHRVPGDVITLVESKLTAKANRAT